MSVPKPPSRRASASTTPEPDPWFSEYGSNGSRQSSRSRWRYYSHSPSSFDSDFNDLTLNEDEDRDGDAGSSSPPHPLAIGDNGNGYGNGDDDDAQSDVSRPTLRRLTSETERQVAESSRSASEVGSNRGSLDLLRMSTVDEESREVEVLIHHVKPAESLAGIALLYGIDVALLRKINKLWTSDSVHLRTHLYVPVEACRWNKASETFIRGPGPGQITLVPKHTGSRKGKEPMRGIGQDQDQVLQPPLVDVSSSTRQSNGHGSGSQINSSSSNDVWDAEMGPARAFLESTNMEYDRSSIDSIRPQIPDNDPSVSPSRVVDVVRIPNSELRFFPKPHKPPETGNYLTSRRSLEMDMQRGSIERKLVRSTSLRLPSHASLGSGPAIQNDLYTLPPPLQPHAPGHPHSHSQSREGGLNAKKEKDNIVRIRPSASTMRSSSSTSTLADRLTSFFYIPPPPDRQPQQRQNSGSPASSPRKSYDPAFPSSRRSSSATTAGPLLPKEPDVLLEMRPRGKAGVRINSKTTLSSKKID